jgi:hypothetical protein
VQSYAEEYAEGESDASEFQLEDDGSDGWSDSDNSEGDATPVPERKSALAAEKAAKGQPGKGNHAGKKQAAKGMVAKGHLASDNGSSDSDDSD